HGDVLKDKLQRLEAMMLLTKEEKEFLIKEKKKIFYLDLHQYQYLLKDLEDLHLDERIIQLLSMINVMFTKINRNNEPWSYEARNYTVVPLRGVHRDEQLHCALIDLVHRLKLLHVEQLCCETLLQNDRSHQ
ncbi:unnamed protein product, partial [Rotaria magnacalcarata]